MNLFKIILHIENLHLHCFKHPQQMLYLCEQLATLRKGRTAKDEIYMTRVFFFLLGNSFIRNRERGREREEHTHTRTHCREN